MNFNNMKASNPNDIFVTGFNTPQWNTALSFGNPWLQKIQGLISPGDGRIRFLWQSPLVNGTVSAFNTIDAQVNYRF